MSADPLPPAQALLAAQRLLDDGRPFSAHEVLEAVWKVAPGHERDLWQGLAQVTVAVTHAARGNANGTVTLLRRASARLSPYRLDPPHGVAVGALVDLAERVAATVERDGLDGLAPTDLTPRLRG